MRRLYPAVLPIVVVVTGATALVLQVTWQRVVALHTGADLAASMSVVAAFLCGMGLGALLGGAVADRCSPGAALGVLAGTNAAIAAFALVSVPLLYDVARVVVGRTDSFAASFAFDFTALLVPAALFGAWLPLLARAVTHRIGDAGTTMGRYLALNTFGAAVGAFLGGWYLIGNFGFVGVTRMVAALQLGVVALLCISARELRRSERDELAEPADGIARVVPGGTPAPRAGEPVAVLRPWPAWAWYVIYGLTGAISLGFEQVFFRLVGAVMRANTYTFAHVLTIYLVLWAIGAAAGSALLRRVRDPRRWFLGLLLLVGVSALASLAAFTRGALRTPLATQFLAWFNSDGSTFGLSSLGTSDALMFGLVVPLGLMTGPVIGFGAAFPFAQALVSRDLTTLGRSTGRLVFSGIAGNVIGTVVTGSVLIGRWGTAGAYVWLSVVALLLGATGAVAAAEPRRRWSYGATAAVIGLACVVAAPDNDDLWAVLHGAPPDALVLAEDRSCVSVLRRTEDGAVLVINGASQNGYPFDDFHVLIGLVPALAHPRPQTAVAIGFGIGSTTHALLARADAASVTSVELCGGNYELAGQLAAEGAPELQSVIEDPRHRAIVGDGRKHLLAADSSYDLIVPDTLVPFAAGSNNVYSVEFLELARSRLSPDGLVAVWAATPRVVNSVTTTFPYVVRISVGIEDPPKFLIASRSPIDLDPQVLLDRLDALPDSALPVGRRASLRSSIETLQVECLNDGSTAPLPPSTALNRDLRPRDEYFINGGGVGEDGIARTC